MLNAFESKAVRLALALVCASLIAAWGAALAFADDESPALEEGIAALGAGEPFENADADAVVEEASADGADAAAEEAQSEFGSLNDLAFVFVAYPDMAAGESQLVAVGLADEGLQVSDAVLTIVGDDGEEYAIECTASAPGAFAFEFGADLPAGSYRILDVAYACGDEGPYLTIDLRELGFSFAVVDIDDATDAFEDALQVYYANAEGDIVQTDNVEEALQASAAAVGVSTNGDIGITTLADSHPTAVHRIVALDPGHGGVDGGAQGNGLSEADCTWKIAVACRDYLLQQHFVVLMTRGQNDDLPSGDFRYRVQRMVAQGAEAYVSIHINAATSSSAHGASVWGPTRNGTTNAQESYELMQKVLKNLLALGISQYGKGIYEMEAGDEFTVIARSLDAGIPGILIEHCFISNASDAKQYLTAAGCAKMGVADAQAIVAQFANTGRDYASVYDYDYYVEHYPEVLEKCADDYEVLLYFVNNGMAAGQQASDEFDVDIYRANYPDVAKKYGDDLASYYVHYVDCGKDEGRIANELLASESVLELSAHVAHLGWEDPVTDGHWTGSVGFGLRMEALTVQLCDGVEGSVAVQAYVDGAWQDAVGPGEMAGTTGKSLPMEAVRIQLSGDVAERYDLYYRAYNAQSGWMGWAANGESAGYVGAGRVLEAVEAVVVPKGETFDTGDSPAFSTAKVHYTTHVQTYGWQGYSVDGDTAGTTGQSKRLEAIKISLGDAGYAGSIQYRTHVQTYGWEGSWASDGAISGTSGESKRLEAIQIRLTGEVADHYDVYYRVHAQQFGWLGWAKNGESAGTAGYSYRLEGIQIVLVEKDAQGNSAAPDGGAASAFRMAKAVRYRTHVQNIGWQDWSSDGGMAGTEGQSKRLEAINIVLGNTGYSGTVQYRTHVQTYGWEGSWASDGAMSGTSGESKRLEAIQIRLTGDVAKHFDVYYRVHAQQFGWLGWAKNGESAGTAGYSYRLEGIEIVLVEKGGEAPDSSGADAFHQA